MFGSSGSNNGASPPGGPSASGSAPAEKPSMWQQGLGVMKAFSKEVQKGVKDISASMQRDFNDIKVQCPSCGVIFRWPKDAKEAARCGACGTLVQAPATKDKASFHWNTFVNEMGKQVRALQGKPAVESKTTDWHIVVPKGAVSGQQVNVTINGKLYRTTVPQGLKEGDTFPIKIQEAPKVIAAKGKALPIAAGNLVQVVPDSNHGGGKLPENMERKGGDASTLPVVDAFVVEDADHKNEYIVEGVVEGNMTPVVEGKVLDKN